MENTLTTNRIREKFLDFFSNKDHKICEGAPLVPNDPTILFTIAGMVQFKKYFLGLESPPRPNLTSSQRCIRTNDIDNVGKTPRHLTSFEMLGTFSFGGYFKEKAIEMAWNFLVEVLGIDSSKLVVSVYEDDEESYNIWHNSIGLEKGRIHRLGKDTNFWKAAPTGPCGPSTEIYYCYGSLDSFDPEDDQYLEVWNLVFTQYNALEDGSFEDLPKKNIDTGMGLERIAMVSQDVNSCYDIDLFYSVRKKIEDLSEKRYGGDGEVIKAFRVILDHLRSSILIAGEGVIPSNEKQGYVLRRLIRRAARFGNVLDIKGPFLSMLVPIFLESVGSSPTFTKSEKEIEREIFEEEERFRKILKKGLIFAEEAIKGAKIKGGSLDPEMAFKLYDTYGFPIEMTQELCEEKGVKVNLESFNQLMRNHQQISRGNIANNYVGASDFQKKVEEMGHKTQFLGYDCYDLVGKVLEIFENGEESAIVLDKTPFYAESGGQVSDSGHLIFNDQHFSVKDVQKIGDSIVHFVNLAGNKLSKNDEVLLKVDFEKRDSTARHHTSIHLLHSALKKVLGDDVNQAGSLVTPEKGRLDFCHKGQITELDIRNIESLINGQILANVEVKIGEMEREKAFSLGAVALFGDKYGEKVRVVDIPNFSMELCGGTHVKRTGDIGLCKVVSEGGISNGVRRMEIVSGAKLIDGYRDASNVLKGLSKKLKISSDKILEKVTLLMEDNIYKGKELEELNLKMVAISLINRLRTSLKIEGVAFFSFFHSGDKVNLKRVYDTLSKENISFVISFHFGTTKAFLVSKNLSNRLAANTLFSTFTKEYGGRGGGNSNIAQGQLSVGREELDKRVEEIIKRLNK